MADSNGFVEYRRLILAELERLSAALEDANREIAGLRVELATIKTRLWYTTAVTSAVVSGAVGLLLKTIAE